MIFSDSIWNHCRYTGRSTVEYLVFNTGGPIDHYTYVLGSVAQSSAESKYNSVWTTGMDPAHFRIINN